MSRKEINVGTSPNKGDGDPLRTAFRKINENFAELYTGNFAEPDVMTSTLAPDTDGEYNLGKIDKRWTDLYVKDFIFLNGSRIELTSNGTLLINGGPPAERQDTVGSIFADDSTVMVDGIAGKVVGPVDTTTVNANTITASTFTGALIGNVTGNVTGDITGSVFGDDSTLLVDGNNNKIVGAIETASLRTSDDAIILGNGATAGAEAVSIGKNAGDSGDYSQAIGNNAGNSGQGVAAVALGSQSGETSQGTKAIAVGQYAGQTSQGTKTVAIGDAAGKTTQGTGAIAVGSEAGGVVQGASSVALGKSAGYDNQGDNAVAVGYGAGETNQAANSIVINASGTALNNTTASSLVIKPIRNATMTTILGYDATSGEVTHNAAIPGYTNTADLKALVAASTDFADFQTRIAAL